MQSSQNDVWIIEIQQKFPEQEPILFTYFEKDANRGALDGFQFWIENQNCEKIPSKMVCELLKSTKK